MTRGGDILGTAAYMSPEQARGLAVDKRSDIWAFGCVLFEMLTGRQAFCGDTVTDIIVSVLTREIDCTAIPRETPAGLRRLLNRCLHRDPWRRLRDVGDARAELDEATATTLAPPANVPVARTREVEFQRLTDLVGLKESPAISPDGKMAAFVAYVAGHRQIWVRLLAGGALLQVTHDSIDHAHPRWAPDSCTLIYYTPSERRDESGTIWEVSALGGWPRPVARALGGADISHDGQRIALFQISGQQQALMIVSRDGSRAERVGLLAVGYTYTSPRWAPDDSAVAFLRAYDRGFEMCLEVAPLTGTEHQVVARSEWLRGFSWLPDGSGFVYGSSRGSTLLYPPVFNLRTIGRRGNDDRQLSFGDQSFVDPDAHQSGKLLVSRFRSRSDIWRFPTQGSPAENTRDARRVTRQTGHVQVPTASPDGTEVAYVSDSGGHANLWIARTDGSSARQLTFDHDPTTSVGVARWSPTGGLIVFLMASAGGNALWAVEPNGSGLRRLVAPAWSPCWSSDGRWLYYQSFAEGGSRLEKVSLDGQHKVVVRDDPEATFPTISPDGRVLYFVVSLRSEIAGWLGGDVEIRCAEPEDGPSRPIARVTPARAPFLPLLAQIALSPDGTSFTIPMVDGATTNLWSISTKDGAMKPLTDFGDRSVLMTRSVSWSADGRFLYAALAEYETDIVLIDGLLP